MMTSIGRACLGISLLLLPSLSWAQASADLFTADYSSRAGNWTTTTANDNYHTMTRVAAGGPNALDALETVFTYYSTDPIQEIYLGGTMTTLSDPGAGVSRFYRWYEWHHASNTYAAADGEGSWRLKRLMIADGGNGDRAIINTDYSLGTGIVVKGIFDGTAPGSSAVLSLGAWHSVQVEVTYNTGPTNSVLKVWVDTDTYASPTFTVSAVAVVPSSSGDATYGRYSNDTLASGGQFIFREAAFRIATTFDSNWYGWISGGGGGSSNPRFSPSFLRRASYEVEP